MLDRTIKSYIWEIENTIGNSDRICLDELNTKKLRTILKQIVDKFGSKENKMFDKEINCYNIIISDYVSAIGGYRHLKTEKRYTEEEAVKLARKYLEDKSINYDVKIEQVCNLIGWDEGNFCECCGTYIPKERLKICDKCASEYKF